MLLGIGPGVTALQDYSAYFYWDKVNATATQGDSLDTLELLVHDPTSSFTIVDEDDIVLLDRGDPTGWPTVNLLLNPSFEGTYVAGLAPNWGGNNTGAAGVTVASSATAQFGAAAQQLSISNAANALSISVAQPVTLPADENGAVLRALPYYFSFYAKTTAALTGANAFIEIDWYSVPAASQAPGNFLSSTSTALPTSIASFTRFVASGLAPAGAVSANLILVINTTNAVNSGGYLIDGAQFERATFGNAPVYNSGTDSFQTALASGKYPTTYCDATQPGCNVDRDLSGCAYRQLRLFGGFIRTAQYDYTDTGGSEVDITIDAVDYGVMLAESPATFVLPYQADTACITQAFTYGRQQGHLQGIDYTTYVEHIGNAGGHVYSWETTRDVVNKVANQLVAAYYVDYHKFLHFSAALAVSAPHNLSSSPDNATTFPFSQFKFARDSTPSITTPVIEGSTQLSAPQVAPTTFGNTTTLSGTTATLSGNIAAGVTAIPVTSGGTSFSTGSKIAVGVNTANVETLTVGSGSTATSIVVTTATTKTHSTSDKVGAVVIANGASFSSLSVAATTGGILRQGTIVQLNTAAVQLNMVVSADTANGATSIPVNQGLQVGTTCVATADFAAGQTLAVSGYQVNGGNPIVQVDSASEGATSLVIGLLTVNTYSQGYTALLDPSVAQLYFQTNANNADAINVTFRFNTPVLVRLHASAAEAFTGTIRRKIHTHLKIDEIITQQAAVDRANAELAQRTKAQPVGQIVVNSPPWPAATPLRPGMAIAVTFPPQQLTGTLFQIQRVQLAPLTSDKGIVGIQYQLDIGFYQPDFAIKIAQAARDLSWQQTATTPNQVLQDVIAVSDGWTLTDSASASVSNIGVWAPPNTSTWNGTNVWG